jgi:hypothetical protein
MELITILNRCHRFRGFVYQQAHFSADKKSIEAGRPLAKGFGRSPLTLPLAGARLRPTRRTAL